MKTRYIQDPVTLRLMPADEYCPQQEANAPFVLGDISPYQSMATGEMIMGRRQHREHLKQHRLIEIGNEKQKPAAPKVDTSRRELISNIVRSHFG